MDGDGNVWLLYNLDHGKEGGFYKVKKSDLNLPSVKSEDKESDKSDDKKDDDVGKDDEKDDDSGKDDEKDDDSGKDDSGGGGSNDDGGGNGGSNDDSEDGSGGEDAIILKGETIDSVLQLILDIFIILVPIAGVIGISVMGVQYMTAGGDEVKAQKAKRRMFEIVIGLVAYALMFAVLKLLNVV